MSIESFGDGHNGIKKQRWLTYVDISCQYSLVLNIHFYDEFNEKFMQQKIIINFINYSDGNNIDDNQSTFQSSI